jgi:hypothetical protein
MKKCAHVPDMRGEEQWSASVSSGDFTLHRKRHCSNALMHPVQEYLRTDRPNCATKYRRASPAIRQCYRPHPHASNRREVVTEQHVFIGRMKIDAVIHKPVGVRLHD